MGQPNMKWGFFDSCNVEKPLVRGHQRNNFSALIAIRGQHGKTILIRRRG